MWKFSFVLLSCALGVGLSGCHFRGPVAVGLNVGPAPVCPYGYYDLAPYDCAPAGYYGPEWFDNGIFVGAGPWFHGREDFRGQVDNHFRRDHGYRGSLPARGERPVESSRVRPGNFHGNEMRDGRGHRVRR